MSEKKDDFEFEIEGEGASPAKGSKVVTPADDDPVVTATTLEGDGAGVEIVADTPEKDRGRKPAKTKPADPTEEELAEYSEKVQKRIREFTRGYHDERRAREAAEREREEAIRYARTVAEHAKQLQQQLSQGEKLFIEQAKKATEAELAAAERDYKTAYEAGDANAIAAAQKKMTAAQVTLDRIVNYRPPVQTTGNDVYNPQPTHNPTPQVPKPDDRSLRWQRENPWFGQDEEMTSFAMGVHEKLVREGVDPRTEEYYERINARMRQKFPENFDDADPPPPARRAASPVAPATRGTASPKKIRLTQTQVALAKKLGIPLEQYARQVAALENRNG